MEAVRLLPQSTILQEWWQEVKGNFWEEDAKSQVLRLVRELMESTMKEEMVLYTGRERYERKRGDGYYRNGYYKRALVTQFGTISEIKVPTVREGSFRTNVFKRYKRYQDIVEDLIEDIFLAGISTRRVGAAISKLLDTKVSHGTVSNITKRLDKKVKAFHKASILDEYQYLFLDAITLKIRYNSKYHNRKVLVAYGISVFGQRKLLAFMQSKGETADSWEALVNDLYRRGLKGDNLRLVTIDGSKGLRNALRLVYPRVPVQRCWVHKLRNISNYLKKTYHDDCIDGARRIYKADDKHRALVEFKNWRETWSKKSLGAVHCLEKDMEELLTFFDCPKHHRIRIRTTNVIERSFREVRRRTRVFSCFSNRQSCERIIYAIFTHLNNQWKECPIKEFTEFA
jgi:transposase-like protein